MSARCHACGSALLVQRSTRRWCSNACRQRVYRNGGAPIVTATYDLRLGGYRDVLTDVECDALIADPPYGPRTHRGHDHAVRDTRGLDGSKRRALSYVHWTSTDVDVFVEFWAPRTRGWMCVMTDSSLAPAWQTAMERTGRYTFAPLSIQIPGMTVRLSGDGPSSWTIQLIVSRPRTREWAKWGTVRGGYTVGRGGAKHIGGKPIELMRQIITDYTEPGMLVCDPCAGFGTTGLAALELGRRFVGCEIDPGTHRTALDRYRNENEQAVTLSAAGGLR
jgi:site-specific DNA-methyltransferase (adenine-specific)